MNVQDKLNNMKVFTKAFICKKCGEPLELRIVRGLNRKLYRQVTCKCKPYG